MSKITFEPYLRSKPPRRKIDWPCLGFWLVYLGAVVVGVRWLLRLASGH
jgi:hypothetical protein